MRYILPYVLEDLNKKMVFVGSPRQVGKTTLAKAILSEKFSDENVSTPLLYYASRLNPKKATQIVAKIKRPYNKGRIKVIDPISYFQNFF